MDKEPMMAREHSVAPQEGDMDMSEENEAINAGLSEWPDDLRVQQFPEV